MNMIPNLMPHQLEPFNGDTFVELEFLKLKSLFAIERVIETGTCLGGSTVWFSQHFDFVATIESNENYLEIAVERCAYDSGHQHPIYFRLGDSAQCLGEVIKQMSADDHTIFFLDAHWGENWPVLKELKLIELAGIRPVIIIHDFKVPGKDFQFDSFHGQPLDISYIKPALDLIYQGGKGYGYHYNSYVTGARVGVIFIYPIIGEIA